MNEDQVTTLLDRLGQDITVAPAPVDAVTDTGRRRLRRRHGFQVVSTAAAVVVLVAGGLVLQQQLVADRPATTNQAPVVAPSIEDLVGQWTPIMLAGNPRPPEGRSAEPITFALARGTGRLTWNANDGCLQVGGPVRLGPEGAFHASVRYRTELHCLGIRGSLPLTQASAFTLASRVQIHNGTLRLTSDSGSRLGVFVSDQAPQQPPGPTLTTGRVPTEADLTGAWRPIELGPGPWATVPDPYPGQWLAFDNVGGTLRWHGEDGCNSVGGRARLGATGSFATSGLYSTLVGCSGPGGKPPHTEVNVMLNATAVRLVDHGLAFYQGDTRLGLFVRGKQPAIGPPTRR